MTVSRDRLARIILAGLNDIQEWRLGDSALAAAKGYPREYPAEIIDDWGILFVDVTLDAQSGMLACHEVNGPNAVGSDALTGDSQSRSRNEADQTIRRVREMGFLDPGGVLRQQVVTLHAHQHWPFFRTGGEFYPRVADYADCLSQSLPGNSIGCFAAEDPLEEAMISVVVGDVPSIAQHITVNERTGAFSYRDRPVVFIGNPNLLSELIRTGKYAAQNRDTLHPGLRVFHAWRLCGIIHEKADQQALFANTGIRPLRNFVATEIGDVVPMTRQLLDHGPVVLKPSNTSGGAGVQVVTPDATDTEIGALIAEMQRECGEKYGANSDAMIMPITGFEFVRSTGYPMDDGNHLWDLRIAVMFEPGKVQCYPVSLRLTPDPFDAATFHRDRRQWVSNVSGRRETLLKSGMDDEVLDRVGMSDVLIEKAMLACVRWTSKAWDCSMRDGGKAGAVFEDFCEEVDLPFYRGEEFTP
jgi:hypothetical protein